MSWSLEGKTCMVTGGTSGIGKATVFELARAGASLVMICRDRERAERTRAEIAEQTGNKATEILLADLASLEQVREAARRFLASERPLHVLLNNAGLVSLRRRETTDGHEATFAVNHLAHFLLTNLLLERIRASAPARIVNVSSDAHRMAGGRFDFGDVALRRRYRVIQAYGRSKLANLLFTRELARRLEGTGVTVNALHPGMVSTRLGVDNGALARLVWLPLRLFARSPERGAQTSVYLCASPELSRSNGSYFYDCRVHRPAPAACNDEDAQRLWELSARLVEPGAQHRSS